MDGRGLPVIFCHSVLAFLGGSVGAGEWVVLFVVVLLVVGPKRLPEIARKLGRTMEMFRRAADEFKDQLLNMDQETPSGGTSPSADASASPGAAESYDNPYPDASDYPGNEDHVENWGADHADSSAPEAAAAAENAASEAAMASGDSGAAASPPPEQHGAADGERAP
jgi:TatA/E family protein of Tat protein translocase